MKSNIFRNHLKQQILLQLTNPLFYIIAILLPLVSSINFYIRRQFFSSTGSTDLVLFFSVIPYIFSVAIPALCFKNRNSTFEDFIPLSKKLKTLSEFLSIFILYSFICLFSLLTLLPVNFFGNIDSGKLFTSLFCILLFGAAVISFCLFLNQRIETKIASLLLSIFILLVINITHLFTVYFPFGNFFTTIFKILSFAWHFDAAGKGILDTRDIFWLTGCTVLFFLLTDFEKERKAENNNTKKILFSIGLICLTSVLMLNTQRYYKRFDLSQNKTYSLSKYTKKLLKEVKTPVKITYYRSSNLSRLYPQVRDISDFLQIYSSQNKNVSLVIKDPDSDSSLGPLLDSYEIKSQQMRTIKNNSTEYINVYSAITLEAEGKYEVIPFSLSADSLEYDLDGRLKHILFNQNRVVNLILGNGMNYNEDYSYLVPWLSSQGFICNPIFINDPHFVDQLNEAKGLLYVIGDSQINIEQAIAIENYILNNKGNALFNVSPYSVDIENSWNITQNKFTNVVEMLENWGIFFEPEITGDISCSTITMLDDNDSRKMLNYPLWVNLLPQENSALGGTVFWATPITINEYVENVSPYLISSPSSFTIKTDKASPTKLIETNPFTYQSINIKEMEKQSRNLAVEISGDLTGLYNVLESKDSKIIVISDPYMLNSLMTSYNSIETMDYRNFQLITNILLILNNENELAELQNRITVDTSLFKITDEFTFVRLQLFTYFYILLIVPAISILFSIILYILLKGRRHEK